MRDFRLYLGPQGCYRRLESITEIDIRCFAEHLKSGARSPGTVNTIVRKHLSGPFEKARKLGKIKYNPIGATDPLKHEQVAKDTFTPQQVVKLVEAAQGTDWEGAIRVWNRRATSGCNQSHVERSRSGGWHRGLQGKENWSGSRTRAAP